MQKLDSIKSEQLTRPFEVLVSVYALKTDEERKSWTEGKDEELRRGTNQVCILVLLIVTFSHSIFAGRQDFCCGYHLQSYNSERCTTSPALTSEFCQVRIKLSGQVSLLTTTV